MPSALRDIRRGLRSAVKSSRNALQPTGDAVSDVAAIDMLAHNWWLGFTSFGGPTVHFQIFQKLFVDEYKWIESTTYQEMFALTQALSGPASTKMLYGINIIHYGFWTGVLSFFVWSLPMAITAFGLALGVQNIGEELPGPAYALLSGLNSATVGIVALAGTQLSQKAVTDKLTLILVFLGATAGMLYNALWFFPVLMAVGGTATIIWDLKFLQRTCKAMRLNKSSTRPDPREQEESIEIPARSHSHVGSTTHHRTGNTATASTESLSPVAAQEQDPAPQGLSPAFSWKGGIVIIVAFVLSFTAIMVCRGIYSGSSLGFDLFSNFYLAGTIIFGGGPVVIPLLREYIVAPGWVSARDFLLGLAFIQAFPGPNFNFAVYLGALAVRGTDIPAVAGALIGFFAIFLPGLWLYTGFMGLWATVRKVQAVRACLRGIHATAVGLVFTAVYRIFQIGYLDSDVQGGGSLSRDPWWVVIVATSYVGGMHFKLTPVLAILLGAVMGLIWYGVTRA